MSLSVALASQLARIALGHVRREYPTKLDHVIRDAGDLRTARELHPIFFGSFDWHSCVHAYWLLATLLRRVPSLRERLAVRALFDGSLTPDNVAGELAYVNEPGRATFERPYGWAWLLMLRAELALHRNEQGRRWAAALAPLASAFAERFRAYLPRLAGPSRAGTHANTAFALALTFEYASGCDDAELLALVRERALTWYANDVDCQAWEPAGEDFLSPALVEAECMRRVLARPAFDGWLRRFLPRLERGEPATLFHPVNVSDRSDGRIAHLDGLNLSRAWCLRGIATALDSDDGRRARLLQAARLHADAALPHLADDFMGEHWLATFALLALTAGNAADP